jgi:putative sporulation protein YyaC
MFSRTTENQKYIDVCSATAFRSFTDELYRYISRARDKGYRSIAFVCIGTDRSTGDSLGPLIGYKISNLRHKSVYVYGNLENPVHAKNLDEAMRKLEADCVRPFVIAVDACLGELEHVGYITIGEGPIRPGSGVNKELPPVGDMFVTGIVNFGGFMDFLMLQNTRLNIVMKIADLIAAGIRYVLWRLEAEERNYNEDFDVDVLPEKSV